MSRRTAKWFLALGILGGVFVLAFAVGHYVFGVPVYERYTNHLASPAKVAAILIVLGAGFSFFGVRGGWWLFRRNSE